MKVIGIITIAIAVGFGAGYFSRSGLDSSTPLKIEGDHEETRQEAQRASYSTEVNQSLSGETKNSNSRETSVPQIPVDVSPGDANALLGVLGGARSHKEVLAALQKLMPRLKGSNPSDLANAAIQLSQGLERDMALMLALGEFAERDPEGALRFAESLPSVQDQDQALKWIASGLPHGNMGKALTLANKVANPDVKRRLVSSIVSKEAETNPSAAMKAIESIEDPRTRAHALAATAESWASSNPEGALNHAVTSSDPAVRTDLLLALSASSEANSPQVFEAVLSQMPSGMAYQAAISDLFENWAAKDPSAAAVALSQIPPGPALDSATSEVVSAMANSRAPKKEIVAWIGSLPQGSARTEALDSFYSEWGQADPSGAIAEVARLSGSDRNAALTSLVNSWAGEDPASVLEWGLRGANGFDGAKEIAVQSGIMGIARVDPNKAAQQVGKVPLAMQAAATTALVEVWSEVDAESAAAWLASQPKGPAIDGASSRLALSLSREDPEMAMEWALGITAQESRAQTAREVAQQWKKRDPNSAKAYASKMNDLSVSALFAD